MFPFFFFFSYILATFPWAVFLIQIETSTSCWDFWFPVKSDKYHSTWFNKPLWSSCNVPRTVIMKSWFKRPSLTLKEWTGTFLGGGGVGRSETLWKGTSFGMDCKRWSEFQLVEEHSMSKNRKEEESGLSKQKGRWAGEVIISQRVWVSWWWGCAEGGIREASEAGEGDRILVWFLEAGCRIMDALAYETKRECVLK